MKKIHMPRRTWFTVTLILLLTMNALMCGCSSKKENQAEIKKAKNKAGYVHLTGKEAVTFIKTAKNT